MNFRVVDMHLRGAPAPSCCLFQMSVRAAALRLPWMGEKVGNNIVSVRALLITKRNALL